MAVKIISHEVLPAQGIERLIVEDCHGRKLHIHAGILAGPIPETEIQKRIAEFEEQEKQLSAHIEARFDKDTLQRKAVDDEVVGELPQS